MKSKPFKYRYPGFAAALIVMLILLSLTMLFALAVFYQEIAVWLILTALVGVSTYATWSEIRAHICMEERLRRIWRNDV